MSNLILCDGDWTLSGNAWECTGTVSQIVYTAPVEYTAAMATEALFQGFSVTLPLLAVAWGGRRLLELLR